MHDEHQIEDVLNGFQFVDCHLRRHRKGSNKSCVWQVKLIFQAVLFSLINSDVHLANVQKIPALIFIKHFHSSVSGPETKNFVSTTSRSLQRLEQTNFKERQMFNMFCLNWRNFRSFQRVLQNIFFFILVVLHGGNIWKFH